jgi:hypothetical protein
VAQPVIAYGWLVYLGEVGCVLLGNKVEQGHLMSLFLCPTTFEDGIQHKGG